MTKLQNDFTETGVFESLDELEKLIADKSDQFTPDELVTFNARLARIAEVLQAVDATLLGAAAVNNAKVVKSQLDQAKDQINSPQSAQNLANAGNALASCINSVQFIGLASSSFVPQSKKELKETRDKFIELSKMIDKKSGELVKTIQKLDQQATSSQTSIAAIQDDARKANEDLKANANAKLDEFTKKTDATIASYEEVAQSTLDIIEETHTLTHTKKYKVIK